MTTRRKTCSKCAHFTLIDQDEGYGSCDLALDYNDGVPFTDRVYGWDYEGYIAGVHVGNDFGCIHWQRKETNV